MPQKKNRIITVDGVGYSLDTGKSIGASSYKMESQARSSNNQPKADNTLDLRHFSPEPVTNSKEPDNNTTTIKAKKNKSEGYLVQKSTDLEIKTGISTNNQEPPALDSLKQNESKAESSPVTQRKVKSDYFKKVIISPFRARVDRYVVQSFLLSTMISPYFWFLALAPGLVVKLINTQHYSATDLLERARRIVVPGNYYPLAIGLGLFLGLCLVSLLISYLVRIVARATKLRAIDHRSVSSHLLYKQAANKSLRSLLNWLLNTFVVCLVITVSILKIWWLVSSQQPIIVSSISALLPIASIVLVIIIIIFMMRWPISQTMISATDKSIWFVQWHSLKLAFGSILKNLLSALFIGLMSFIAFSLITLIGWAEVTYLSSSPYLYMQISLFVIGAILMLTILVSYRIWRNMFFASHYYVLASTRGKVAMSNYLSLEKPAKTSIIPFVISIVIVAVVLAGYSTVIFIYHDSATTYINKIHNYLPTSLEIKIPKPTK